MGKYLPDYTINWYKVSTYNSVLQLYYIFSEHNRRIDMLAFVSYSTQSFDTMFYSLSVNFLINTELSLI